MQLRFFCPRWGSEALDWNTFALQVKAAGYDGVEYGIASDTHVQHLRSVAKLLEQHGLLLIAQHFDTVTADFEQHKAQYAAWFELAKMVCPYRIDSQTGKDYFTFGQNQALIEIADAFTAQTGIPVFHETHRNKFTFAAHVTRHYLEAMPSLRITLDASHWVNVAESYLTDQPEAMQLAIERAEHIHARVGHTEGPQVPDPRVPEWQEAVEHHLGWWDRIIARKRQEGADAVLTITPEFGPAPYMPTLPYTRQPITSQWDVNAYMLTLLKNRYL
jgi:sugar phosphate isomerase/epimerase